MTAGSKPARLSNRAQLTWFAHLFKSCVKQHHRELITPLRRFIPEDAVILDVGGHAGQFAKLFARMAPKGARLHFRARVVRPLNLEARNSIQQFAQYYQLD